MLVVRSTLLLTLITCAQAFAQQNVLVGRLVNAGRRPPEAVSHARVTLLDTNQETVTDDQGRFQFALRPTMAPGVEVQIAVKAGDLLLFEPLNGVFTLARDRSRLREFKLLPAGSGAFLDPVRIEELLAQAAKPPATQRNGIALAGGRESRLANTIREYAASHRLSLEDVEREVRAWGERERANRAKSNPRKRALAEFEARHFGNAANLFGESAEREAAELDSIEKERKDLERKEAAGLGRFLNDKISQAAAFTEALQFDRAVQAIDTAAQLIDRQRYAAWWAEFQARRGAALLDAGINGDSATAVRTLQAALSAYNEATGAFTTEASPHAWANIQIGIGLAHAALGGRLAGSDSDRHVTEAISTYESVLKVLTNQTTQQWSREVWAIAQADLAAAWWFAAQQRSGSKEVDALRNAIECYGKSAQVFTESSDPQKWGVLERNLSDTHAALGRLLQGPAAMENLQTAVSLAGEAARVSREKSQIEWGQAQASLALAYLLVGAGLSETERANMLRKAKAAAEDAAHAIPRDQLPQSWAYAQQLVGDTRTALSEILDGPERAENLQAAVAAYKDALQVYTAESLPRDWARTVALLGDARVALGALSSAREAVDTVKEAIADFRSSLRVRNERDSPGVWAATEQSLGRAYRRMGELLRGSEAVENLRMSIDAFTQALRMNERGSVPQLWAATKSDLGQSYLALGAQSKDVERAQNCRKAMSEFEEALQVWEAESFPQSWAGARADLSSAQICIGQALDAREGKAVVASAVENLKEVLHREPKDTAPYSWAWLEVRLGKAYFALGARSNGVEAAANYQAALVAFENALQVYAQDSFPSAWAEGQQNLAEVYRSLAETMDGRERIDALNTAIACYKRALEIWLERDDPSQWADTQLGLAAAYLQLALRADGATKLTDLNTALLHYQNCVRVFTRETPVTWAAVHRGFAAIYFAQGKWQETADAEEQVIAVDPTKFDLAVAYAVYHDRLYRFDRALEIAAKRVEQGDGEADFIEAELTAAEFEACASRATEFLQAKSDPIWRPIVAGFRFACLTGTGNPGATRSGASQFLDEVSGLQNTDYEAAGIKHFMTGNSAFAPNAPDWIRLFEALERGDEGQARDAVSKLVR
jgi:tetratricopeptide (TPR) repeat protein